MTSQDLTHLEKSVAHAGTQLNTVAIKLSQFERNLENPNGSLLDDDGELDDEFVMELLESMAEVKNDYQNLRKDIQEVQQLQKEMTSTIRFQMSSMHQTFKMLKKRIELNRAAAQKN